MYRLFLAIAFILFLGGLGCSNSVEPGANLIGKWEWRGTLGTPADTLGFKEAINFYGSTFSLYRNDSLSAAGNYDVTHDQLRFFDIRYYAYGDDDIIFYLKEEQNNFIYSVIKDTLITHVRCCDFPYHWFIKK